jgi:hypothetical protein
MRTIALLCGLLAFGCQAMADGTNLPPANFEAQGPKSEPHEKKVVVTPAKPAGQILGKRVVYGGYLTEMSRAEKKRGFFSLRTPIDPNKDLENVSFYPGTDKVQGIILFSIKF